MKYCKRCLYPENHPLNLVFDDEGVCSGCRVHEEKDSLDWTARGEKLGQLLRSYKSTSKRTYDCIIPVSGARDSYFIVHTVKNVYGMNPLLVSYNRHYNTRRGLRNFAYLKTLFNCDTIEMVADPAKIKRITRYTLKKFGSMHWHALAGQTVFPVQAAVRFNVPLIVWGAHQGLDQVGMYSHTDEVEMTRKYRKEHDLMGYEAEDLINAQEGVSEQDVLPFFYPHDKELEKTGVRGIYLGNYIRWDSKTQHEKMIDMYGYETAPQQRTFDTYNDVNCQHYSGIHDYTKFLKWGYGKVTDHATREIRLRRMTREQGVELVKKYQNTVPQDLPAFTNWIDMEASEFYRRVNQHRDSRIWKRKLNGDWELLDSVVNHKQVPGIDQARLSLLETRCEFRVTPSKDPSAPENEYILLHKGYMNKGTALAKETGKIAFRAAQKSDGELLLAWRNDPQTRAQSLQSNEVGRDEHLQWLEKSLLNPKRRLLIAVQGSQEVGTVRFDLIEGSQWELSWTVSPQARGIGVGKEMVKQAAQLFPLELVAKVKPDNNASLKIASHAGFVVTKNESGFVLFHRPADKKGTQQPRNRIAEGHISHPEGSVSHEG